MWDIACKVLRKHYPKEVIFNEKVQDFDFSRHKGNVGLVCGGPPCQPWSHAGAKKGQHDPRDVMGFTPDIVAICEPDMFCFENVPGLLSSSEHADYREMLWARLRSPKDGVSYGLDYKVINAADYGVPQVRKRVFIIGIKGKPDSAARRLVFKILSSATHHDPKKTAYKKKPWVVLRDALSGVKSEHPWRVWNVNETVPDEEAIVKSPLEKFEGSSSHNKPPIEFLNRIGICAAPKEHSLSFEDGRVGNSFHKAE